MPSQRNLIIKKNISCCCNSMKKKKHNKETIPKAIREQCWIQYFGKVYEHKCHAGWCENVISVFDFHVGHDKPYETSDIFNIKPICGRCELFMNSNCTIKEWNKLTPENFNLKLKNIY